MIKRANELASVIGDIESDYLGSNEDRNNRSMEAEDQRKNKYEHTQMRDDDNRLKGLGDFEVLVR